MSSGNNPILRINGELQRVDHAPLESDDLKKMLYEIAPEYKIKVFEETGDVDFGYEIPNISRFRANFFNQKYGIAAVFRQIPTKVLSFEDFEKFDAPLPAVLKKFAMLHRGLVVVTGPTGSGKSTTLAAMLDYANKNRRDHVITVEDPIEFVHESKNCLINHRETGVHTPPCAAPCARTRTSSWWASCATWRPSSWPSSPPAPATWSSAPSTRPAPPRPWTASSTSFPPTNRTRFARRCRKP
jgi:twitching motility protein PilT